MTCSDQTSQADRIGICFVVSFGVAVAVLYIFCSRTHAWSPLFLIAQPWMSLANSLDADEILSCEIGLILNALIMYLCGCLVGSLRGRPEAN